MDKLRIVFVEHGLGKYYIYNRQGVRFPFIEMNINMYHFNKDLFYWVLSHELDHYIYFQDPDKEGKRDINNELLHCFPNALNVKMIPKLTLFEIKSGYYFRRGETKGLFAVNENKGLLYTDGLINYHECKTELTPEEEKEIIEFVSKVNDL